MLTVRIFLRAVITAVGRLLQHGIGFQHQFNGVTFSDADLQRFAGRLRRWWKHHTAFHSRTPCRCTRASNVLSVLRRNIREKLTKSQTGSDWDLDTHTSCLIF